MNPCGYFTPVPGRYLIEAIKDALKIAPVYLKFNGETLLVEPHMTATQVAKLYDHAIEHSRKEKKNVPH